MGLNSGKVPDIVREVDDSAHAVVDAGRKTPVPSADDQQCRAEATIFRHELVPVARAQVAVQFCEFEFLSCVAALTADLTRRTGAIDDTLGKSADFSPTRSVIDARLQECTTKIAVATAA